MNVDAAVDLAAIRLGEQCLFSAKDQCVPGLKCCYPKCNVPGCSAGDHEGPVDQIPSCEDPNDPQFESRF